MREKSNEDADNFSDSAGRYFRIFYHAALDFATSLIFSIFFSEAILRKGRIQASKQIFLCALKKLFDKSENTGYRRTNLNYEVLEWIVIGKKVWKKN
jgi:hypothetical protein